MTKNNNLKVAISSFGDQLTSEMDLRFGRCKYFLIVELEKDTIKNCSAVLNTGAEQDHGAGLKAGEQIGDLGVNVVITGELGPRAVNTLNRLKIKAYKSSGGAQNAVKRLINNELEEITGPRQADNNLANRKPSKDERIYFPLLNNKGVDSEVSSHFGHAPYFGLYSTATMELKITDNKLEHNSEHRSPVDQIMASANPTMVYAQGIGGRAISLFAEKGVSIKTGPYPTIKEVVNNLDSLKDLTEGCRH